MSKGTSQEQLAERLTILQATLQKAIPHDLAMNTAAPYYETGVGRGEFRFKFWERQVVLTFPDFRLFDTNVDQELPVFDQAMVLYYFHTCDGTPMAGKWVSFSELPDARFYHQAFHGYTGKVLVHAFKNDLKAFERAAWSAGGEKRRPLSGDPLGDTAFAYQVLPRVSILVVYWLGDEDFPPSCQILYDAAVRHHLPTDACAILGSTLTRRLVKSAASDADNIFDEEPLKGLWNENSDQR